MKETCNCAFPQRKKKGVKKGNLANHTSVQLDAARLSPGAALLITSIINYIYTADTVGGGGGTYMVKHDSK